MPLSIHLAVPKYSSTKCYAKTLSRKAYLLITVIALLNTIKVQTYFGVNIICFLFFLFIIFFVYQAYFFSVYSNFQFLVYNAFFYLRCKRYLFPKRSMLKLDFRFLLSVFKIGWTSLCHIYIGQG